MAGSPDSETVEDAFVDYMHLKGKLGGQNKLPRLSDDSEIADEIEKYIR